MLGQIIYLGTKVRVLGIGTKCVAPSYIARKVLADYFVGDAIRHTGVAIGEVTHISPEIPQMNNKNITAILARLRAIAEATGSIHREGRVVYTKISPHVSSPAPILLRTKYCIFSQWCPAYLICMVGLILCFPSDNIRVGNEGPMWTKLFISVCPSCQNCRRRFELRRVPVPFLSNFQHDTTTAAKESERE